MKNCFFLSLTSLFLVLVLSTSGTYALTDEFSIVSNGAPAYYELDFLNKDNSYVDMTVEVLELELEICSVFVIDNYQKDELAAIMFYFINYGDYPWADPFNPPSGSYEGEYGIVYFADLEPIEVYLGGTNLTLNSKRTISGYLGPLSQEIYSTSPDPYDPNNTITITEYRDFTYFVVLESTNPSDFTFGYAKVYIRFVSTLPAPSAVAAIVVLSSVSLIFYRKKNRLKS